MNEELNEEQYFNQQLKIHHNKFLHEFALLKLKWYDASQYTAESFGSWFILIGKKRLLYDGKDDFLILQSEITNAWKTKKILNQKELNYKTYMEIIIVSQTE